MNDGMGVPRSVFWYGLKSVPGVAVALIVVRLVAGFGPAIESLLLKVLFDLLGQAPIILGSAFLFAIVGLVAIRAVMSLTDLLGARLSTCFKVRMRIEGSARISELLSAAGSVEKFEDPESHNQIELGVDGAETSPGRSIDAASNGLQALVVMVSLGAAVGTIGLSFTVLILLAAILHGGVAIWIAKLRAEALITVMPFERESGYLRSLLTEPAPVRESRALSVERLLATKFVRSVLKAAGVELNVERKVFWRSLGSNFAPNVVLGVVAFLMSHRIQDGSASVGDLALVLAATQSIQGQLTSATESAADYFEARVTYGHFKNIHQVFDQASPQVEPDAPGQLVSEETVLACVNVGFKYSEPSPEVLNNINLEIRRGETIAIVGKNGSGKSTLMKLMVGLRVATSGTVLINGLRLNESTASQLRRGISWMPQDFNLFDFSLQENVDLGRPHDRLRFAEIAKQLGLDEIAASLDNGYETDLSLMFGDGVGVDLSGGQWQRIALARCLLSESQLVFLDEPTSALDPETEVKVLGFLKSELSSKSAVIVTHRLPVLELADRVAVVENGRILALNAHEILLEQNSEYSQMFAAQQSALNRLAGVSS